MVVFHHNQSRNVLHQLRHVVALKASKHASAARLSLVGGSVWMRAGTGLRSDQLRLRACEHD